MIGFFSVHISCLTFHFTQKTNHSHIYVILVIKTFKLKTDISSHEMWTENKPSIHLYVFFQNERNRKHNAYPPIHHKFQNEK